MRRRRLAHLIRMTRWRWLFPWRARPLSFEEQEVTESLRRLKSLSCVEGRVSISANEVLTQPGYIEARRAAAECLRPDLGAAVDWASFDEIGAVAFLALAGQSLRASRREGISLVDAIERLKTLKLGGRGRLVNSPAQISFFHLWLSSLQVAAQRCNAMQSAFDQQLLSDVLYGDAVPVDGLIADDDAILDVVQRMSNPCKPVRQWLVLDVLLPAEQKAALAQVGLRPRVVFACSTVAAAKDLCISQVMLSGYQRAFQNYLFQDADDKLYLLVGRGGRKWISIDALGAVQRFVASESMAKQST